MKPRRRPLWTGPGARRATAPRGVDWIEAAPRAPRDLPEPLERAVAAALARVWESESGEGRRLRRVVVVVPDSTRCFPHRAVARAVLDFLSARGVAPGRVHFLVACGVHTGAEPEDLLGEVRRRRAKVSMHDADGPSGAVGRTRAGTPVALSREYLDADLRIAIGGTSFHYFAGFGGGPKLIFPGLASREGALANHRLSLGPLPPGGLANGCEPARTDGNPVARDIAEACAFAPPEVSLHLVAHGNRYRVESGNGSLERARGLVLEGGAVGPRAAADLVAASAGGSPLGEDLVQAHKALYHASLYARPGGAILLAASLKRGAGSRALERWLGVATLDELEQRARAAYDLNAQTAISLRRLCQRHPVIWLGAHRRQWKWVRSLGARPWMGGDRPWLEIESAARRSGGWERGVSLPFASGVVPVDAAPISGSQAD